MTAPWLSVVIPTIGRPSLANTLMSYARQGSSSAPGLELVVVGDSYATSPTLAAAADMVAQHMRSDSSPGVRVRYLEHDAGVHCFGHPQRMEGARVAAAPWVAFSQDDNIAAPDALAAIRASITAQVVPRPLFFRVRCYWNEIVWKSPHLAMGNIDADCLVLPKVIAEHITWGLRYEGDFDAALEAARMAQHNIDWREDIIAWARPVQKDHWWQ